MGIAIVVDAAVAPAISISEFGIAALVSRSLVVVVSVAMSRAT